MKGRRQARRAALQALYELDLTRHALNDVLSARIDNLYDTAAVGVTETKTERMAFDFYRERVSTEGVPESTIEEAALQFGVTHERAQALAQAAARACEQARYAAAIVRGVSANRPAIDVVIARIAPEWPVEQMAPIDRNVLRIALWEIAGGNVPERVAINEAVELARQFSGEGSRRMVNGALGAYVGGGARLSLEDDETGGGVLDT